MITPEQAAAFDRCVSAGGVAVFPADTVYGVCCSPQDARAVERLYELKGRPQDKPAAVMCFALSHARDLLSELPDVTRSAVERLLPGPVTVLVPNRAKRFPLACGPVPQVLGLRVPALTQATRSLGAVALPVLQSSANASGAPDARVLADVPNELLGGADLALDAGALPGTPSTVVDFTRLHLDGSWEIKRAGAHPADEIARAVRWNPAF